MDKHKTMVVFRVWTHDVGDLPSEVIAVFPCERMGDMAMSYSHIGQHSFCHYGYVVQNSRPATPAEAMGLGNELKDLGYRLAIRRKAPTSKYWRKWKLVMGNA